MRILRPMHRCVLLFLLASGSMASLSSKTAAASGTEIIPVNSGQCLQASGASTTSGAAVVQQPCAGLSAEKWTFTPLGSYYHVVSQNSGLCLTVEGASTQAGAALIQSTCQSRSYLSDQWTLQAVGHYYRLVARSTGQCATVSGDSSSAGGAVIQSPCQGSTALDDEFYVDVAGISPLTLPSSWTPVIPLPVNPIAVANLPNGNVLMWSAYQQFSDEGDIGNTSSQTWYGIFNPVTQGFSDALLTNPGADMFCPGTALLANGNVLVNGGSSSSKTTIFNRAIAFGNGVEPRVLLTVTVPRHEVSCRRLYVPRRDYGAIWFVLGRS